MLRPDVVGYEDVREHLAIGNALDAVSVPDTLSDLETVTPRTHVPAAYVNARADKERARQSISCHFGHRIDHAASLLRSGRKLASEGYLFS
jgi:hypothetical protein